MRIAHPSFPGLFLILASSMALLAAWFTEHVLHINPCILCLVERWPWRILLALGVFTTIFPIFRVSGYLSTLVLLSVLGLSFCHAGVEWGWWQSPFPGCHAPHITGSTMAERLASMPLRPAKPCDYPTYLIPGLPISMAVMDGLYACLTFCGYFWVRHRMS